MKRKRATIPFLVAAFLVAIAAKGVAWQLNRVVHGGAGGYWALGAKQYAISRNINRFAAVVLATKS